MAKNKLQKKVTISGYVLFALLIIATFTSTTIPFFMILQHPDARHENVIIAMLSLTLGALLPALIAYFMADAATRSKNRTVHHFNGILFATLAFPLSILVASIISQMIFAFNIQLSQNASLTILNSGAIVVTTLVTTVLAFRYAKHRRGHKEKKNASLLVYKPYQIVMVAVILLEMVIAPLADWLCDSISSGEPFLNMYGLLSGVISGLIFFAVFGALSWRSLLKKHTNWLVRATLTAVLIEFAWLALYGAGQLIPYNQFEDSIRATLIVILLIYSGFMIISLRREKQTEAVTR